MAKFCTKCGNPIEECTCNKNEVTEFLDKSSDLLTVMKNRMGIGEPETNGAPPYERGMKIIPECVRASEGEIPVKQYTVAKLRTRLLGIPIAKAEGRVEVTNKRVIFRALGRSLIGRLTLQQEFSIDDVAGMEVRREFTWSFWDFLIAIILIAFGGSIGMGIIANIETVFIKLILALIFGVAGMIPFFIMKKRWWQKLICTSFSLGSLIGGSMSEVGRMDDSLVYVAALPVLIAFIIVIVNIFLFVIKPNLVMVIKTKSYSPAVDVQRMKNSIFANLMGRQSEEHTGYTEVIPIENSEEAIRELGAVITDIQKFGDFGIEKWKVD